ncbi:putative ribonuclease H-like domain-containing protein, partial [Tanacetum coccineum]
EVFVEKEVPVEGVVSAAEETVNAATITKDEITLAQALAEFKSVKPTATTKGILRQEPSESITTTTTIPSKDKGKAEFDKEVRLAREKDEVNVALIKEWNDIQAKIEPDYELAQRLQAEEQEELTVDEKDTLFQQLLEKRRKHFAAKKVEEKRNRPPTRAQQRSIITELVEGTKMEESSKRARDELEQENAKKQNVDDDQEAAKMKELMKIILNEEEVAVDAIPLATKPPSIVDWKIVKEGKISYYQIIRVYGSSKRKVYLVGRRGPVQAVCTAKELREILAIKDLHINIKEADLLKTSTDEAIDICQDLT